MGAFNSKIAAHARHWLLAAGLVCVIVGSGCGRDALLSQKAAESLRVTPGSFSVFLGQSFAFDVVLETGSGSRSLLGNEELEVTAVPKASLEASNAGTGLAQQPGPAQLIFGYRGLEASASVNVVAEAEALVSLAIVPDQFDLRPGEVAEFAVVAVNADGESVSVATRPNLILEAPSPVAFLEGTDRIVAQDVGEGTLVAQLGPLVASAPVSVRANERYVGLEVTPSELTLAPGETATFQVFGLLSNGGREDLTFSDQVNYLFDGIETALVNPGFVVALSEGPPSITRISLGERTVTLTVLVEELDDSPIDLVVEPTFIQTRLGESFELEVTAIYRRQPPRNVSLLAEYQFSSAIFSRTGNVFTPIDATSSRITVEFENIVRSVRVEIFAPEVTELRIEPDPIRAEVNQSSSPVRFIGILGDGTEVALNGEPALEVIVDDPGIALWSGSTVEGIQLGRTTLQASYLGRFASAMVEVGRENRAPRITSVAPNVLATDAPLTTIAVTGSGFSAGDTVLINGSPVITQFLSSASLTFANSGALFSTPGTLEIVVEGAGGVSNEATLRIGERPNVASISPSAILANQSIETRIAGTGLVGATVTGLPLSYNVQGVRSDGTTMLVDVTAGALSPQTVTVTVQNDFGTDIAQIEIASPQSALNLQAGGIQTLSGTNVYSSVSVPGFSAIVASGTEPVVILSAGDVTLNLNSAIFIEGDDGQDAFNNGGAGGVAGSGGGGGGGGADGNAVTPAQGGAGAPAGNSASASNGSGTPAGNGGGAGAGEGAANGCAEGGGGGGGPGGAGGAGGGDSGVGQGGAGGGFEGGSAFGAGTGGGGGTTCGNGGGAGGGGGGGKLIIQVASGRTIRINGTILAGGGAGGAGFATDSGGGGGGSGGTVELRAPGGTIIVGGSVLVEGGTGGPGFQGSDGGGGGGGGLVILQGSIINAPSSQIEVSGGEGGDVFRRGSNRGQDGNRGRILRLP